MFTHKVQSCFRNPLLTGLMLLAAGLLVVLIKGCSGIQHTNESPKGINPILSIHGGLNKGGIVENTDMEVVAGAEADAFSGATRTGFNAGVRATLTVGKNALETGIDYMMNSQTFIYNDDINRFHGKRDINTYQFILPVTWNLRLFRNYHPEGLIHVKFGGALQFNQLLAVTNHSLELPDKSSNIFSGGGTLGLNIFPVNFDNGARLGLYFDLYRGSQIYIDYYNQPEFEVPGSSYRRFGIVYQFGN